MKKIIFAILFLLLQCVSTAQPARPTKFANAAQQILDLYLKKDSMQNEYMTKQAAIIQDCQGVIDKYKETLLASNNAYNSLLVIGMVSLVLNVFLGLALTAMYRKLQELENVIITYETERLGTTRFK